MVENVEKRESNNRLVPAAQIDSKDEVSGSDSVIGVITALGRSATYRFTTFYLRTPAKLFKPPRFDIYHYIREVNGIKGVEQNKTPKFYHKSSLYVIKQALHRYGWKIIPQIIIPPIFVNSLAGTVLYSTYIYSIPNKLVEDITWGQYFTTGSIAGLAQAIMTTPIDAIYVRSHTHDLLDHSKRHRSKVTNLWVYGWKKWKQLGVMGCYGGFNLTALKEMVGFGCYFSIFESMRLNLTRGPFFLEEHSKMKNKWKTSFITFISGVTAAFTLQCIQFPIGKLQRVHYQRLEIIDLLTLPNSYVSNSYRQLLTFSHIYWHSYVNTFKYVNRRHGTSTNKLIAWLYRGFIKNTLAIIPSTTAGLMLLDYMRRNLETL